MPILEHLWIIPLLPLLGATVNGLFGRTWPNKIVNSVAIGATGLSFLAALEAVREFFLLSPEQIPWVKQYFSWIEAGNFRAGFDLQVDQLTVVMLMVVTGVGWLIHIYSTGYMAHEGGYYRFFICGLGRRRAGELFADRVLFFAEVGGGCWQESIHREPHRRLWIHARD